MKNSERYAPFQKKPEPECDVDLKYASFLGKEPQMDVKASSPFFKKTTLQDSGRDLIAFMVSLTLHLFVAVVGFMVQFHKPSWLPVLEEEFIEVQIPFGFTEEMALKSIPSQKKQEEPSQATKAEEELPQVAKNTELDIPVKEEKIDMPAPVTATPRPSVAPTPRATPSPTPALTKDAQTDPSTPKLSPEELAKRMEKEQREVAKKNQEGKKQPSQTQGGEALPDNPFGQEDVPSAPQGLGVGDLKGKFTGNLSGYALTLRNHMRRYWDLPDTDVYEKGTVAVAGFILDYRGHLVEGSLRITLSSGQSTFDAAVLRAIEEAHPFPSPPEGEPQRRTYQLKFSPKQVE